VFERAQQTRTATMKGIYKRHSVFWLRRRVAGKELRESLHTDDEATAIIQARKLMASPAFVGSGEWDVEIDRYFEEQGRKGNIRRSTESARRYRLKAFSTVYGIESPAEITKGIVQRYYDDQAAANSVDSARACIVALRSFCDWMVQKRRLRENPCREVEMAKERRLFKTRHVEKQTVKTLLENCESKEMKLILFLGFDCGLRLEEIVQARPSWINLDAGTLQVRRSETWEPKDCECRTIPLTSRLRAFLAEYMPEPFLIAPAVPEDRPARPGARRKWRYRYDPSRPFRAYMEAQKMAWVTFKTMRDSFGSIMVSSGVEIARVSRWMGHSKLQTTMDHYISFMPNDGTIDRGTV
jgi:integrase